MLIGLMVFKWEIVEFRKVLESNFFNYIVQLILVLFVCLIYVFFGVVFCYVDLCFFVLIGDQVWIIFGGLMWVVLKKGFLVVNFSQGGGIKDIWVFED